MLVSRGFSAPYAAPQDDTVDRRTPDPCATADLLDMSLNRSADAPNS